MSRFWTSAVISALLIVPYHPAPAQTLKDQNEALFKEIQEVHQLSDRQMGRIRDIFTRSGYMGQGNPAVTSHPVTEQECKSKPPCRSAC